MRTKNNSQILWLASADFNGLAGEILKAASAMTKLTTSTKSLLCTPIIDKNVCIERCTNFDFQLSVINNRYLRTQYEYGVISNNAVYKKDQI